MFSISPVKVFWTGGWDSTFLLLHNLFVAKATVVPFYIVDPQRKSTLKEFQAIVSIRRSILARLDDPTRLRPIQIRMSTDYPVPGEIATALATLKRNMRVGIQYQWLAAFCAHEDISGIELCFQRNPIEEEPLHKLLKQFIDPKQSAQADPSVRAIFKYFSIALTDLTKADMVTIARQHGFYDILTEA